MQTSSLSKWERSRVLLGTSSNAPQKGCSVSLRYFTVKVLEQVLALPGNGLIPAFILYLGSETHLHSVLTHLLQPKAGGALPGAGVQKAVLAKVPSTAAQLQP